MELQNVYYTYYRNGFNKYLIEQKYSEETIRTRKNHIEKFFKEAEYLSPETYREYVETMVENENAPATINSVIATMNCYLRFLVSMGHTECSEWAQSSKKVLRQQYLDDILSMADYEFLLKKAAMLERWKVYLYARIAGTTGMRLCEMLQIKREHIEHGCVDIYGKSSKRRRIYFPTAMRTDILDILNKIGIASGYIFSARDEGEKPITKRGLQASLTRFAEEECELPKGLVHAHGFRHFFAKEFIRKYQNIALLADLLGHSNIEMTRIYLKYTSREQADIVNEVVTW